MSAKRTPGQEARERHGWLGANRWLIARRLTQLGFFLLFAIGPWLAYFIAKGWLVQRHGFWIAKGTLASSLTLDVLPLTDPLVFLQSVLARHWPETSAIIGALIVLAAYLVLGGRLYCSWVCPINPVTDLAAWTRRKLGIEGGIKSKSWSGSLMLAMVLIVSALTGTIAYELVNPITTLYRGLLFGLSWGMLSVVAIFLIDVFVARNAWCQHECPVGAFYTLLNHTAMLRVSAFGRERCDDCMDCFAVCPEMHVIKPALKGAKSGEGPIISSADCTACGRCIDVCAEDVFRFTHRFDQRLDPPARQGKAAPRPETQEAA